MYFKYRKFNIHKKKTKKNILNISNAYNSLKISEIFQKLNYIKKILILTFG